MLNVFSFFFGGGLTDHMLCFITLHVSDWRNETPVYHIYYWALLCNCLTGNNEEVGLNLNFDPNFKLEEEKSKVTGSNMLMKQPEEVKWRALLSSRNS